MEIGNSMTNPRIMFLPGFMCDERLFAPQIHALSSDGFDCRVATYGNAASIERMAKTVLDQASCRTALVGLSMGAIVALEAYRQAPGRITHLALLNTTARADAAGTVRNAQLKRVVAGGLKAVLRDELKPQYLSVCNRTPDRMTLLEAMGLDLGNEAFVRQTMALTIRNAAFDLLPQIHCPTLVLAGKDDGVCPLDRHTEMTDAIPGAVLIIVNDCGHISTLEQPEHVTDALRQLLKRPSVRLTRNGKAQLELVKSTARFECKN
ncbi:alpha/beta fold hydrolase [Hyphomonas sp.]|uniref:alpha/beta fold hydrolase n=1 Tax=Hyphomonas sp. TaxID=87 RepID=UPI00356A0259